MIFVYRAAVVAFAAFVSALVGFGLQQLLPAAYIADAEGMIGSIVGLVALLLSLVLGLLISTSHGPFTAHHSQMQTVGRSIARLDMTLKAYGPEAKPGVPCRSSWLGSGPHRWRARCS
jgi:high-affinity Fe2+/Pb2+ permease